MSAALKENEVQLPTLVAEWFEAKRVELKAIEARRAIDTKIVALMPKKDEGSESKVVGLFKVIVTFGINRKVDSKKLDAGWGALSETVRAAFRRSYDVAAKEYKALSGADLTAAIDFVESKPASPSVKIEVVGS